MPPFALDFASGPPVVGVLENPSGECGPQRMQIQAWAREHGIEVVGLGTSAAPTEGDPGVQLIIALGGDGTILRALRLAMMQHAAVLGVNFGHLGFLADIGGNQLGPALDAVTGGSATVDVRTALVATLQTEDAPPRGGVQRRRRHAPAGARQRAAADRRSARTASSTSAATAW